jgi:hypothetical protein
MTETKAMLSTIDNPFNPFDDFTLWKEYDDDKGYNSCGYLARIVQLSDDMTQKEEDLEVMRAIDEIVTMNPLGIYVKVERQVVVDD